MTPMVDIAFLLVIFFMTTTVFREPQAIEITLPPSKAAVPTAQSNVITLRILKDGTANYNIADDKPATIPLSSVESLVVAKERKNIERQPNGPQILAQIAEAKGTAKDSLEKFMKRKVSKLVVLVMVDRESRYEKVVDVMDQIQHAKMARFSIIPLVEEKEKPGRGGK
jgi:biopolymer transport protein ExbD